MNMIAKFKNSQKLQHPPCGERPAVRGCTEWGDHGIAGRKPVRARQPILRMIRGAPQPDSGSIAADDVACGDALDRRRRIGSLLDHRNLHETDSPGEPGVLRRLPRAAEFLTERVEAVVSVLGLEAIADRRTNGFSQGERMKTALGRALLHSPQNLLLDELTNGLDIPTIRSLRDLLRRLRDSGACIVYSSHVLEEVRALCDRVVIIAGGKIVAQGSPQELCSQAETSSLEEAFIELTGTTRSNWS